MNGILYGEFFLTQLSVFFICYSVLFAISPILIYKRENEEVIEKTANGKNTIKDVISIGITLAVILVVMLGGMYWIIKKKILLGAGFIVLLSFLYCGIAFLVAVFDFIRYVFLKSSDFKLTKEHEGSLWLIGLATYFVCYTIEVDGLGKWIEQRISLLANYQSDIVKILVLIFWYFSIIFFTISFFVLFVHKAIIIFKRFMKQSNNRRGKQNREKKEKERKRISEEIWIMIEKTSRIHKWKKCFLVLLWIFCLIYEAVMVFVLAFIKMLKELLWIVVIGLPRKLWAHMKKILDLLEQDQGKGIIISSRTSLVASLLIVFLVDKYQGIFSESGSEVYEFLCSVIMIPFLITQLSTLKKNGDMNNGEEVIPFTEEE